jgi:hypothetical protein
MPIIRGEHYFDTEFTRIPNSYVRDAQLSLAARGLLAQLLSHAPGWEVSQESLAAANGVGRDAIRSLLNELMEFGYLSRSEKRVRNSSGHLAGYVYTTQDPTLPQPTLAEPTQVEPTQVNPLHKKNILKEENTKEEHLEELSALDDQFEEFYKIYPRKMQRGDARKAFAKAVSQGGFVPILAGVIRFAEDPNLPPDRFVPYPATWLRAESWLDGPLPFDDRRQKEKQELEDKRKMEEWLNEQDGN